ncbi:putative cytochrome P450 120 isoform X5 [Xiphias gladius]|uniref:putative cytochrome P450 120 isoform X5 n=1 Tax=Xiphias gladius TaxID=8245 RepID=UPI001A98C14B|nr:putative cytochrome P450 120 isoform X5 [Xiphias gladius]
MSSPSIPQQPVYRKLFEVIKRLYHQVGNVMLSEQCFSINSYYILPVMVVDIHVFVAGRGMWLCDVFFSTSFSLQCMCALSEGPLSQRLGTELVLGLFLNVRAEEQPELFQEIVQLCTQHWHGLISAPVNLKVPLWSSGFSTALDARDKLMDIIKDKLENDTEGFVGSLGSLPLPDSSSASQHLLLFISALIPKALASLLTSFTLALLGNVQEQTRRRATEDPDYLHRVLLEVQRLWPPFIGGRRIADQDSTLAGCHVPKGYGAIYISHAVHRDPEVFQQPDNFLPERWSGRNAGQEHFLCSFGSGPRNCIGSKLTSFFLKEVCMYLLKHYAWCLDPPSQDLEYKWLPVSRPTNPPTMSFTQLDQTRTDKSDTS